MVCPDPGRDAPPATSQDGHEEQPGEPGCGPLVQRGGEPREPLAWRWGRVRGCHRGRPRSGHLAGSVAAIASVVPTFVDQGLFRLSIRSTRMIGARIGLGGYIGLAVIAAINLALFRDALSLLTIPAIAIFLILLDVALIRLLISRRPLSPGEYGFFVTAFVATMITFPFNNNPRILQGVLDLYRDVTADARTFRFNYTSSFIYAERAALGVLILAIALGGGALTAWGGRWLRRRKNEAERSA
jgi:hypothetical protein